MKVFTILFLTLSMVFSAIVQGQNENQLVSKIGIELNKNQVLHNLDCWQLAEEKGENKMSLLLEAVKYNNSKNTIILKGLKIELIPEISATELASKKLLSPLNAFIDDAEYSEVMVILNQMIADYAKRKQATKRGVNTYTTKGGAKFGFIYTEKKAIGYLSILSSNAEISCEFSNIEKFLTDLRNYIDICSKDLYLPENAEKLKKAKKTNQEAKDVIIEDI